MHRRPRLILLLAAALPALAGCAGAVEATAPDRATHPACARVAQHWPATVAGQRRRETTAGSPAVAAWGDPVIIARCGLSSPGPTARDCIEADGVDWVAHRLGDGVSFVSYGRDPAIEVLVPARYAPEPLVMSAFARAAQQVPQGTHRCS